VERMKNSDLALSLGGSEVDGRFHTYWQDQKHRWSSEEVDMRMYNEFCRGPSFSYNPEQFSEYTQFKIEP